METLMRMRRLKRIHQRRIRIAKKRLRDMSDSLDIPDDEFIRRYRLNHNLFLNLCDVLYPMNTEMRSTSIPFDMKVNILFKPKHNLFKPHVRYFWEYVNMMFNKPDEERVKNLGPDRTCAEWVLRNGGSVIWIDGKTLSDYNSLPPEDIPVKKIREVDGSNSSISHYGFPHLNGCTEIRKIVLHNNKYIDDRALNGLKYVRESLTHLQISKCINVTDAGLKDIKILSKLEMLVLFSLENVQNLDECKQILQEHIPKCKIEGKTASFIE